MHTVHRSTVCREDDWLLPPEVSSNDRCVDLDELTTEGGIYFLFDLIIIYMKTIQYVSYI